MKETKNVSRIFTIYKLYKLYSFLKIYVSKLNIFSFEIYILLIKKKKSKCLDFLSMS